MTETPDLPGLLRQAADRLDELDQAATRGPWTHTGRNQIRTTGIDVDEANWGGVDDAGNPLTDYQLVCMLDGGAWCEGDAAITAALRPVAAPLAAWLRSTAARTVSGNGIPVGRGVWLEHAVAVALAVLGDPVSGDVRG